MIKFSVPRPLNGVSVVVRSLYTLRAAGLPAPVNAFSVSAGLRTVLCKLSPVLNPIIELFLTVNAPLDL